MRFSASTAARCPSMEVRNLERRIESEAYRRLAAGGVDNAFQEARWMLEILALQEKPECIQTTLDSWIERRIAGEPFQYIVGSVLFYDIELLVGPGVLIPRPETELLVERALHLLKEVPAGGCLLDLCTGSGAIALAIASERPDIHCIGVDLSPEALRWARLNKERLGVSNCEFLEGDLFKPLTSGMRFDIITANPPYVAPDEYLDLPSEVKDYEPRMALEADEDGLLLEREIIRQAPQWLKNGAPLILEMGESQGCALAAQFARCGYGSISIRNDLCGRQRFAEGHLTIHN